MNAIWRVVRRPQHPLSLSPLDPARDDFERVAGSKGAALVVVAIGAAIVPMPPAAVERFYSGGLYLALQPLLTSASNRLPFALFDALLVIALGAWLASVAVDMVRARRRGWARQVGRTIARTVVWTAILYLLFLALWGLNYRRLSLAQKLQFDARTVSPGAARVLLSTTIAELNALHERAHADGWPPADAIDVPLAQAFARVQLELGAARLAVPGRPKRTLLDLYFRRAAVEGMTDPYFLETLVGSDLLPFERPFIVAHEWSHLAGFADEGEANFLGWLTCLRGTEAEQYSGWLFLYGEAIRAVAGRDRAELSARLAPGPRDDLRTIAVRIQRQISPWLSAEGWRVYDQYLKANRVEAGAASYAEVVRLALGVRFGANWTPLVR